MSDREELFRILRSIVTLVVCILFLRFTVAEIFFDFIEKGYSIVTETEQIASINTKTNISGNFILGSGHVNQDYYYVAYQVLEDGGKILIKYPAEKVTIYDVLKKDEPAYAEVDKNGYGTVQHIRLYVPVGTVTEECDLSLE